jgi:hypothetical protein
MEVGRTAPEDFESTVRRYVVASPFAKRTVGGKLRAILHLLKGLMTPVPNLERLERQLEIPNLSHAILAADSAAWCASHGLARNE